MEPKVYIVLVNWNGWADSIECMESLLRSTYLNYEIILVDNDSSDGSIEIIKDWGDGKISIWVNPAITLRRLSIPVQERQINFREYKSFDIEAAFDGRASSDTKFKHDFHTPTDANVKLHLIAANQNGGFGAGNNLAFKLIQHKGDAEFIWLLNNDTVVTPNAMHEMVDCSMINKGIVGAMLYYYHTPDKVQAFGGGYFSRATGLIHTETQTRPDHLDFINGASFMLSSQILNLVGYFDENIFLYYEEFDYCFRAARKGFGFYLSEAVVYHKHGASSSNADDSFAWQHVLKNKPYVLKKNFGYGLWVLFYIFGLMAGAIGLASTSGKRKASRAVVAEWVGRFLFGRAIILADEKRHNENWH